MKLQTIQNTTLHISTGCTRDTSNQHLHDETLYSSNGHPPAFQHKQLTKTQTQTLRDFNAHLDPSRNIKAIIFHNHSRTHREGRGKLFS